MKKIVITGGTGFVGANLVHSLMRRGYEICLLVRPNFQTWRIETVLPHIAIYPVDLQNEDDLVSALRSVKPEWVFHLAAYGAYSWQTDLNRILETNFLGTIRLISACLRVGVDTIVNTGSSSEYGFKQTAPSETDWLEPNSDYAVAKASATLFCRHMAQKYKARIFTLRLYSVYGPYEDPRRFIPALILYGMQARFPPLANPSTARDYVYIDDVCQAYLLAATTQEQEPGAVYNVGTGVQTTLFQAVQIAQQLMDVPGDPVWDSMPGRAWDTSCWYANIYKSRRELGWSPTMDFAKGLRNTWEWFQQQSAMKEYYLRVLGQMP